MKIYEITTTNAAFILCCKLSIAGVASYVCEHYGVPRSIKKLKMINTNKTDRVVILGK